MGTESRHSVPAKLPEFGQGKRIMSTLSNEALNAITVEALTGHLTKSFSTMDGYILNDVRKTVENIPASAMPTVKDYERLALAFGNQVAKAFSDSDWSIDAKTKRNKKGMAQRAMVEALAHTQRIVDTEAAMVEAQLQFEAKPTKANEKRVANSKTKAVIALKKEMETSLDKAAKAGSAIIKRKSAGIPGFQSVKKAGQVKAKAPNPAKPDAAQSKAARMAAKDQILQALDHGREVSGRGELATRKQVDQALRGIAAIAALILTYLPEDMRTL